jgi:hypothetical protein
MAKTLAPGEPYSGRRTDAVVINATVGIEAATLLRHYAGGPGRKLLGRTIEKLVFEHDARVQERTRMQRSRSTVCGEDVAGTEGSRE